MGKLETSRNSAESGEPISSLWLHANISLLNVAIVIFQLGLHAYYNHRQAM
jgi:hypothetical protein